MKRVRITLAGETYLTLEGVAECYHCEVTWLREVYDLGLLGHGRVVHESIVIQSLMLARVAEVIRMSVYQGVDLAIVAALLDVD